MTKIKNEELNSLIVTEDHLTIFKTLPTKSAMIRYLDSKSMKKGEIAKVLTAHFYPNNEKKVLFQHVRNVLITPIKGQTK